MFSHQLFKRNTCPQLSLVQKLSIYLAKMTIYDVTLASYTPSERAIGALYVAMRITE